MTARQTRPANIVPFICASIIRPAGYLLGRLRSNSRAVAPVMFSDESCRPFLHPYSGVIGAWTARSHRKPNGGVGFLYGSRSRNDQLPPRFGAFFAIGMSFALQVNMTKPNALVKVFLAAAVALFCVAGMARSAHAAVIVDPGTTSSGYIVSVWGNVTVISMTGDGWGKSINMTVDTPSTMDIAIQTTGCDADARFAVVLDGQTLVPTATSLVGAPFFANYDDVALSAGSHTMTVKQTYSTGWVDVAKYTISVTANPTPGGGGSTPSSVPEPATMILLGTGLFGLVGLRQRRRKQSKS